MSSFELVNLILEI